ncbi:MAG: hypothetical protein ACREN5_15900, partial [Gemmatimonadales bacterium]
GIGAARLGFHYDDSRWVHELAGADWPAVWKAMRDYIPGRPLFVFWQYLVFRVAGDAAGRPEALHLIQAAIDALVVAVFFLVLRRVRVPAPLAILAAGLFAFWPVHGETHFWNTSVVGNLITTLFVLVFLLTSAALAGFWNEPPARGWGLRAVDLAAFAGAMLTYDQVFLVLAGTLWLRARRALAAHLPHAAVVGLFLWPKLTGPPGKGPSLQAGSAGMLAGNAVQSIAITIGSVWSKTVAPLYERATRGDWLLALVVSAALAGLALVLWVRSPAKGEPIPRRTLFGLGLLFWAAAYVPGWLWHLSPRTHYLPSIGLFAAVAVWMAWALEQIPLRAGRALVLAALGGLIFLFAGATRGERRYWEDAFHAKKQLFTELKRDLERAEVLVLENFPTSLGPAHLIYPQDASYAAGRFFPRSLHPRFAGDISGVPAPGGVFLYTYAYFHGSEAFRYFPASNPLLVRFTGWEGGRMRFEKRAAPAAPYEVMSSRAIPGEG